MSIKKRTITRNKKSCERKTVQGRTRKYYFITEVGISIKNHLAGFYSILTESMSGLFDLDVTLPEQNTIFCPNCANKIDVNDKEAQYCEVCGYNIESLASKPKTEKGEDFK